MQPTIVWARARERDLKGLPLPLDFHGLAPEGAAWELELGFGKGRYLLECAASAPSRRFVGVEIAAPYYRLARDRAARRGLDNLVLIRGEAVFLMTTALPRGWAERVHVYFPDPWPKDRHRKRRLFDPQTVDLVLAMLRPGGRLLFASDHVEYGELVAGILAAHPAVELEIVEDLWPDGARTNYEAKFVAEGRPIVRLVATLDESTGARLLHPEGRAGVLVAARPGAGG